MKFITISSKGCEEGKVYEADSINDLFKEHPSLRGKVAKMQGEKTLESSNSGEIQKLKDEVKRLKKENKELKKESEKTLEIATP